MFFTFKWPRFLLYCAANPVKIKHSNLPFDTSIFLDVLMREILGAHQRLSEYIMNKCDFGVRPEIADREVDAAARASETRLMRNSRSYKVICVTRIKGLYSCECVYMCISYIWGEFVCVHFSAPWHTFIVQKYTKNPLSPIY
jgi:hypothetical protein